MDGEHSGAWRKRIEMGGSTGLDGPRTSQNSPAPASASQGSLWLGEMACFSVVRRLLGLPTALRWYHCHCHCNCHCHCHHPHQASGLCHHATTEYNHHTTCSTSYHHCANHCTSLYRTREASHHQHHPHHHLLLPTPQSIPTFF